MSTEKIKDRRQVKITLDSEKPQNTRKLINSIFNELIKSNTFGANVDSNVDVSSVDLRELVTYAHELWRDLGVNIKLQGIEFSSKHTYSREMMISHLKSGSHSTINIRMSF